MIPDEYWPARKVQQHSMLFRAGAIGLEEFENLCASEFKKYRDAGVLRVSTPDRLVVGPVETA